MDADAPLAPGSVQDPALDTTPLPANHTSKFLSEARQIYKDSKPPFVFGGGHGHCTEGIEREVFIAKDGKRPPLPIRANLVARRWGELARRGLYWTLDLNGERFIVQSFPNKGCISGAKWVYCCWTGVGEEFEDLPLAFTCINGEWTCALGRAVAKQATTKTDAFDSTKANSLLHSHLPHPTPLPEDHPIEYLDEARAYYVDSRPPFVVRRTKHPRRQVLLATPKGHFSATSTEAEVVYRAWDSLDDFSTLDVDRKRFIVMGSPGGNHGGYRFRLWLGVEAGRVNEVIAHSSPHADARKARSDLTGRLREMDEDSSSSSSSDDEEDQDPEVGTLGDGEYRYENFINAFNVNATPPSGPSKFYIRQPTSSSSESRARKESTPRKLKSTKRARSRTPLAHFGSRSGETPANSAKRAPHRIVEASDHLSDHFESPYDTPAPTSTTNDRPPPTSEPPILQTQVPVSLPTLTLYKQTHTTLRATRNSNIIGFVPLRLVTCMTMSTLFSSVIAASGHREDEEPIQCLMAVFDWLDDRNVYKTMYIDKGTQGSFEIFLEIIDEAPCWKEEGGKCGVAVEIVRAYG